MCLRFSFIGGQRWMAVQLFSGSCCQLGYRYCSLPCSGMVWWVLSSGRLVFLRASRFSGLFVNHERLIWKSFYIKKDLVLLEQIQLKKDIELWRRYLFHKLLLKDAEHQNKRSNGDHWNERQNKDLVDSWKLMAESSIQKFPLSGWKLYQSFYSNCICLVLIPNRRFNITAAALSPAKRPIQIPTTSIFNINPRK